MYIGCSIILEPYSVDTTSRGRIGLYINSVMMALPSSCQSREWNKYP